MTSAWPTRVAIGDFVADVDGTDSRLTTKLSGWDSSPGVRSGITGKAQQSGGWDGTGFHDVRVVTIEGVVEGSTPAAALVIADQLTALHPGAVHELVVDNDAAGSRSSLVRVTDSAVIEWMDDLAFTYTATVTAPDPRKYGPRTFGSTDLAGSTPGAGLVYPLAYPLDYGLPPGAVPGSVPVANAGTTAYWPTLRIDGPAPNPSVTLVETGDTIRYNGTLLAGQWLDIDCQSRRVLLNGQVSVRPKIEDTGAWLAVPPGGGSVTWTADSADPSATLSVWSYEGAWL